MSIIKTFKNIYDDIAHILKISNADEIADIKNWVNRAYRDFQMRSDWYWRKRQEMIQLVPLYETGTVTVTLDSTTIAGSGTTWTSSMEGRYIQVSGDNAYYRIVKVSSTISLIIDKPYIDATVSGKAYSIWKRFYNLTPDVDELVNIYVEGNAEPLSAERFITPLSEGTPFRYMKAGIDRAATTYTTGTVSGTANTRTITGDGTAWLANAQRGDLFTPVGGQTYNILSIDSDTQLTLVQKLITVVTALDTYSIERTDLIQVEFDNTPTDITNVYYDYLTKTHDLMNDNDEPEIPLQYRDILIYGTIPIAVNYLTLEGGELKQQFTIQNYENRIREIKNKVENEGNQPSGFYWGDDSD